MHEIVRVDRQPVKTLGTDARGLAGSRKAKGRGLRRALP
jgi:hypothetical protein